MRFAGDQQPVTRLVMYFIATFCLVLQNASELVFLMPPAVLRAKVFTCEKSLLVAEPHTVHSLPCNGLIANTIKKKEKSN